MTEYHDRLSEADLPSRIDGAEELLGALSEDQAATLEQEKPHQVPRLRALLLALRPRVEAVDPLLVTEEVLSRTRDPLNAVTNGLRHFMDDGNVEHLNGIREWTETLAGAVALWPSPPDLPSTDASDVAARFRRSAGQQLRGLSTDFEKVKEEITAFQTDVEQRTGEWGEQKTNLETQISELSATVDQQRGRLDEAIERYQGQFSEAQDRRGEEFRNELSELQNWASKAKEKVDQQFSAATTDAQQQATDLIGNLEAELVKAQGITGFIGSTGTSAGYKDEADAQRKAANWLRALAILFGLAAAGLAIWAIVHAQETDNPSFTVVLAKTVGSLVFVGIAGYIATQSGHHRAREEQARQRELDLVALPPFIAALPDGQKEDITGEVAAKLFVVPPVLKDGKREAALTKESISLVGLLLDAIRRG
jgi:gas vesicle protein